MKRYTTAIMALLILSGCAETAAPVTGNPGTDGKTAKQQSQQEDLLTDDPDLMTPSSPIIGSSDSQDK